MAGRGRSGDQPLSTPRTALLDYCDTLSLSCSALLRCRLRTKMAAPIGAVPESHAGKSRSRTLASTGAATSLSPGNSRANLAGRYESAKRRVGCGAVPNKRCRKAQTVVRRKAFSRTCSAPATAHCLTPKNQSRRPSTTEPPGLLSLAQKPRHCRRRKSLSQIRQKLHRLPAHKQMFLERRLGGGMGV
jgi:hypothetical protein